MRAGDMLAQIIQEDNEIKQTTRVADLIDDHSVISIIASWSSMELDFNENADVVRGGPVTAQWRRLWRDNILKYSKEELFEIANLRGEDDEFGTALNKLNIAIRRRLIRPDGTISEDAAWLLKAYMRDKIQKRKAGK